MARIILGRRCCVAKEDISNKGTERNGNHDPTVICHKDEPTPSQLHLKSSSYQDIDTYMSIKA